MPRTTSLAMAVAAVAALTACGSTTPQPEAAAPPSTSAAPSPAPTKAATKAPTKAPTKTPTKGPKLVNADVTALKYFAIDFGVPVVIVALAGDGIEYHMRSRPDGSVDFSGTADTESARMTLKVAKVRKRTEENQNTIVIVSTPVIAGSGPATCVTDKRETILKMEPCRPGDATQAWRLTPAGDSGLFELTGAHTAIRVDKGKIVKDSDYSAFSTVAVSP
jgi:eukaryotic-like serine/threonine-protein kinase